MRRILILVAFVLLWSQSAFASLTYKNSCSGFTNIPADSVSCTIVGTAVSSGDLVVAFTGWATNGLTVSVGDGTSTFTAGSQNSPGGVWTDAHGQFFYILSSIATGTPTYTFTAVGAYAPDIIVYVFTASGAVTFDSDVATAGGASTSVDSGTITTTGSDQLVIGGVLAENGPTTSAWAIGGSSAATDAAYGYNGGFTLSVFHLATTGTVASTATLSTTQKWLANEIGFKIDSGGGGSTSHNLSLMGVGP